MRVAQPNVPMKYWDLIADKFSAQGWSWGYCSAVTPVIAIGSLETIAAVLANVRKPRGEKREQTKRPLNLSLN